MLNPCNFLVQLRYLHGFLFVLAASKVPVTGVIGLLFVANPWTACVPLEAYDGKQTTLPAILLISRGDCDFVTKVQMAQNAGYAAAIVYNNEDSDLVTSK